MYTNYIQKTNLWVPKLLQNGTILNLGQSLFITNKTKTNVIETILIILKKKNQINVQICQYRVIKIIIVLCSTAFKQKTEIQSCNVLNQSLIHI